MALLEIFEFWDFDGKKLSIEVQLRLPDNHLICRTHTADLVSEAFTWGGHVYANFWLENIVIDGQLKEGERLSVGSNPHLARSVLMEKFLWKSICSFSCKMYRLHTTVKLDWNHMLHWGAPSISHPRRGPAQERINPEEMFTLDQIDLLEIFARCT